MVKKILLPLCAVIIVGALLLSNAAPANAEVSNPFSGLIQAIAQKFGLNQNQVQSVVNTYKTQQRASKQQTMQQRENTRLDKLVQQGKITSDQKQQILSEVAKLQSEYNFQSFKTMTSQQRKDTLAKIRAEIQTWSQQTGIPAQYLMPFGMGMRMGWFRHMPSPTPTP